MQLAVVIIAVSLCSIWLGVMAWRYLRPKPGKACGGGCCDGQEKKPDPSAPRTQMISSDDLRARLSARKN